MSNQVVSSPSRAAPPGNDAPWLERERGLSPATSKTSSWTVSEDHKCQKSQAWFVLHLKKILQDRHVVNLKSSSIGFLRLTCPIRSPCSLAEHRCMMPLKLLHCEVEATTCFWHLCGVRSGRIQVAPILEVIKNGVFQSSYQKS